MNNNKVNFDGLLWIFYKVHKINIFQTMIQRHMSFYEQFFRIWCENFKLCFLANILDDHKKDKNKIILLNFIEESNGYTYWEE